MEDPAAEAPQPSPVIAEEEVPEKPQSSAQPESASGFKKFAQDYWEQTKSILLGPAKFFDAMPSTGGFGAPASFVLIAAGINGVMTGLVNFNPGLAFITFGLSIVGVFLCAIVASGLANMMGGKGSLESTFRSFAYSEATLLFQWVPAIGVLAFLYTFVLNYMGLRRVQQLGEFQTLIVVLLSTVIAVFIALLGACGIFVRSLMHF